MSAGKDKYFPKIDGQNIKLVKGIDIGSDFKLMKDIQFVFNGYRFIIKNGQQGVLNSGSTEISFHPTVTTVIESIEPTATRLIEPIRPTAAIGREAAAAHAALAALPPSPLRSASSSSTSSSSTGGSSGGGGSPHPIGKNIPRPAAAGSPTGGSSGGGGSSSGGGSPTPIGAVGGAAGAAAAAAASPSSTPSRSRSGSSGGGGSSSGGGKGRVDLQKGGTSPIVETYLAGAGNVSRLRKRKTRKNINRRN